MTAAAWIALIGLAVTTVGGLLGLAYRHGQAVGRVKNLEEAVARLWKRQDVIQQTLTEIQITVARIAAKVCPKDQE